MTLEKLIFYVLAAVVLAAAVMVVTRRNPVHSALFLILAFFASSGIW
ncbi:MAG: NADH-quinone oxidoreductase subunit J, partial [Candidatus Thiodiazotropha taylori]|nr:NADH-quinone oxidoreductase subunit J [Candidatus Thiodiazotropha taylori]MCW4253497.1 NADH-quinone oxidoreductase subunit J [Candidatus Thiodiazotropha taylori]